MDVIVTWPKTRRLASYLVACQNAKADGLVINYRVRNPPQRDRLWDAYGATPRLYRVHDGFVRGYTEITAVTFKAEHEVARVVDDSLPGHWPAGWYIVCDPTWFDCEPPLVPMAGFRAWRWFGRLS